MKLGWNSIECELDKVERQLQFTSMLSRLRLFIPTTESKEQAEKLLNEAEQTCLISNSMSCESRIESDIIFSED